MVSLEDITVHPMDETDMATIKEQGWNLLNQIDYGSFGRIYAVVPLDDEKDQEPNVQEVRVGKYMRNTYTNRTEVDVMHGLSLLEIRHPSLVYYIDAFECNTTTIFLVMEKATGLTLAGFVEAGADVGTPVLNGEDHLSLAKGLLRGIDFLHRNNILHRDIKPENVMYDPSTQQTKIIDFGLSCNKDKIFIPRVGTPTYWPPEFPPPIKYDTKYLSSSPTKFDFAGYCKADIFAAGITLYETITLGFISPYTDGQLEVMANLGGSLLSVPFPKGVKISLITNQRLIEIVMRCIQIYPQLRTIDAQLLR